MLTQHEKIWHQSLELLRNELTSISFNTWIQTIEPVSVNTNTLTLRVATDFNKGILDSRYKLLIENAVKQATSREYEIRIISSESEGKDCNYNVNVNINGDNSVSLLHPKYTFDTFVVGNSNRFAHAAALAVAEAPARAYNPLFLYGGVGLGKTHLMHAIGNYILNNNHSLRVLYVTSEKFTNELINAIKDDTNVEFRNKYRNIDILLIDDIQFIVGKERTQEEFFHTFNTLYDANKQIIISSDKPPKDITTLEERLRSRFEWGLTADIQPPDYETRIAILRKKAQMENLNVPDEIMAFIAEKIAANIRELEGALNKIIAYSQLTRSEVDMDLAAEVLKDILATNKKEITSTLIMKSVSGYFDINSEDLKSAKRNREVTHPRQIAMYLCRELTELSLPKIGEVFGGRDHTTVMHAIDKISREADTNPEIRRTLAEIKKIIKGN